MELSTEQKEAWRRCKDNYNNLPYDLRKALSDLPGRISEIELLIQAQEDLLADLRRRKNKLLEELVEWGKEDNVINDAFDNPRETFLKREETAQYLGVSLMTLYRWEKQGILTPVRFGGALRYKMSDIEKIGGNNEND